MAVDQGETPGKRVFVSGRSAVTSPAPAAGGGGFSPDNTFLVSPAGDLESFDGVSYTGVQEAMDAASALTPTSTDQYIIHVYPGQYDEQIMTMYQYVHVLGMQGSSMGQDISRSPVSIGLGSASVVSPGLTSAADSSVSNIAFYSNGQAVHTDFIDLNNFDFTFSNCSFFNTSNTLHQLEATTGRFIDCFFINCEINSVGTQDLPVIYTNCQFQSSTSPVFALDISGYSEFYNCWITADSQYNALEILTCTSKDAKWVGGGMRNMDGGNMTWIGTIQSAYIYLEVNASLASQVTDMMALKDGARIIDCTIEVVSTRVGNETTVGIFQIEQTGPLGIVFQGNNIHWRTVANTNNALFFLDNSISVDGEIIIANNTMKLNKDVFAIHSSGFGSDLTITLSGNSIDCMQATVPTNAGAGELNWKGTDVQSVFIPASAEWGTGTAGVNQDYPGVLLDAAAETAYLMGRANPPAGLLIDAGIVLSAVNSDGLLDLPFTDTNGTALATHDADWTVNAGTITIQSNTASATATTGISNATHAHTAANGYLTGKPLTGVHSFSTVEAGIMFRYADSSNYWKLVKSDDNPEYRLVKRVAGVETTMHDDNSALTGSMGVSFLGSRIRVYENADVAPRVVAEIYDTDLMTNTSVGIFFTGGGSKTKTIDDFRWNPGGDVDLTIDTRAAHTNQRFPAVTSSDDDAVPVIMEAPTIHDVAFGEAEELGQVKVTLDVLNGNITEVYVHGLLLRHWNMQNYINEGTFRGLGDDQTWGHSILSIR